tara:strand:+ start:3282 stop:3596 length:315 start_codon:yes stop_codon:yes gene_type:complete
MEFVMSDAFNRHLQPSTSSTAQVAGGNGYIEIPGKAENFRWQSRSVEPTAYENGLADAIEQIYESGACSANEIVEGLNARGHKTRKGQVWSLASFHQEMADLGH